MKKGFTMIELIFVIVILGILAAVAIPRLTATRDDAEVVKAATNLSTLLSDIGAYYTSQGKFAASLGEMTNVPLSNASALSGEITSGQKHCIKVTAVAPVDATKKPGVIKVEEGSEKTAPICKKVYAIKSVKAIMEGKFKYQAYDASTNKYTETESNKGEYAVSGLGIVF